MSPHSLWGVGSQLNYQAPRVNDQTRGGYRSQDGQLRDFPGDPVAKTLCCNAGSPGSISGQGTRLHMPQIKKNLHVTVCHMLLYATTKTQHSQINKYLKSWALQKGLFVNPKSRLIGYLSISMSMSIPTSIFICAWREAGCFILSLCW